MRLRIKALLVAASAMADVGRLPGAQGDRPGRPAGLRARRGPRRPRRARGPGARRAGAGDRPPTKQNKVDAKLVADSPPDARSASRPRPPRA